MSHRRKEAGERKNENEAPRDEEIGTDPHEDTRRNKNDPQRGEGMPETAWDYPSPSCSNVIHLGNSPS